jgi:isocitrate dehydrogenase kinase/phosphatase
MAETFADKNLASTAAEYIRDAFDGYLAEFRQITQRARTRFERKEWKEIQSDARERLDFYEQVLAQAEYRLMPLLTDRLRDRELWIKVKQEFPQLFVSRHDFDLAETFFSSVTRKIFSTVGVDREVEYFHLEDKRQHLPEETPVFERYLRESDTASLIRGILADRPCGVSFENLDRDAELVAQEIDLYLWPLVGYRDYDAIEVIRPLFYRNKVAYIVGRIVADSRYVPLILPLYHGDQGIYVDTVLLQEAEASRVFSFAHSSFQVVVDRHDALIRFLKSIMPQKHIAELYTSIGYNRHGKTEYYRDLHRFVHLSREQFIIAPGREGAVMIVFTMPDYDYVLKVIKDRPCFLRTPDETSKTISKAEVKHRYNWVCHRDRVGRMVDTQEFENLRFKRKRFSEELLEEFRVAANDAVNVLDESVVIHHVYVQRRVTPLLIYLQQEKDPEQVRRVLIDFGYFLKDLAAAGIFPSDLFNIWNYGVTRRGRVVLYDYDDVMPLERINFRIKPLPQNEFEEMESESDWIVAMPDDYFLDEMERYSGLPQALRAAFKSVHGNLYTLDFWNDMQRRIKEGEIVDITPYDRTKSFRYGTYL